ncbi:MAG: biopolymer transporter ExbD [Bacteroidetes bacterium]|nr:biopolymer transporter ExbD [Bacteroidota bacterium]
MPKVKVPRKSTTIDMTAMCDVAFLLLSFFILATKTKPPEILSVETPSSVSTRIVPEKDAALISIDKDGRVFFSLADNNQEQKLAVIESIDKSRNLGLTAAQKKAFTKSNSFIGVPFSQLASFLSTPTENLASLKLEGIPVTDSTNNQLIEWMAATKSAFEGKKMELLVKGDNNSKYPSFQGVIAAFKKNDLMKFSMVTNPEGVPTGSELYNENQKKQAAK